MPLEDVLKTIVAEAVREALDRELPVHLAAVHAAQEPSRLLAEALAGADDEKLARIRRLNALAYLDAEDAAQLLGIGRHQVYRLVRAGSLHATKIGNRLVMRREDIDRAMRESTHLDTQPMARTARRQLRGKGDT